MQSEVSGRRPAKAGNSGARCPPAARSLVLGQLSQKERLVISLYYYEELTQKEIAEAMELSEGRVSQLHSQALIKLKTKLDTRL